MGSGHSRLGGSGAERWMECPGSNAMLEALDLPESDESDYAAEGTAAHEAGAQLLRTGCEAWELVGEKFYNDIPCTVEMADAIQMYGDFCRPKMERASWWVEEKFSDPRVHKDFFGQVDFGALQDGVLDVVDFKYGAGITVEAVENRQLLYYGYALHTMQMCTARTVRLSIVQPRAYHEDGPIRTWEISGEELAEWGEKTLIPAMNRALFDHTFDAGAWCRFCPAKLVCPLLDGIYKASAVFDPKRYATMDNDSLGRDYNLIQAIKFRIKAIEDEVLRRALAGQQILGTKLVNKKTARTWKAGAEERVKEVFGPDAFTAPELKSPAELEKLGSKAKELTKEFAFMPHNGFSVARADDPRPAVRAETIEETYGAALAKISS